MFMFLSQKTKSIEIKIYKRDGKKIIDEGLNVDETSPLTLEDQCYQCGVKKRKRAVSFPIKTKNQSLNKQTHESQANLVRNNPN